MDQRTEDKEQSSSILSLGSYQRLIFLILWCQTINAGAVHGVVQHGNRQLVSIFGGGRLPSLCLIIHTLSSLSLIPKYGHRLQTHQILRPKDWFVKEIKLTQVAQIMEMMRWIWLPYPCCNMENLLIPLRLITSPSCTYHQTEQIEAELIRLTQVLLLSQPMSLHVKILQHSSYTGGLMNQLWFQLMKTHRLMFSDWLLWNTLASSQRMKSGIAFLFTLYDQNRLT